MQRPAPLDEDCCLFALVHGAGVVSVDGRKSPVSIEFDPMLIHGSQVLAFVQHGAPLLSRLCEPVLFHQALVQQY